MEQTPKPSTVPPPDISSLLDKLLAHPELISMVATTLGAPSGASTSSASPPPTQEVKADPPPEVTPTVATEQAPTIPAGLGDMLTGLSPLLSKLSSTGSSKTSSNGKREDDHRACLLRALKPYLNSSRQEAIDYMIRLSELSLLLKHLY